MTLSLLTAEEFQYFSASIPYKSFMQSLEMAALFEKRGYQTQYVGLKIDNELQVAALITSMAMLGGKRIEVYFGPLTKNEHFLSEFYQSLKDFAIKQGALELIVKPFDTYQSFDNDGLPLDKENNDIITNLTSAGYQHKGLVKDFLYWHYVKDLTDLSEDQLLKSFSKKGKPLVKKASTFGIELRRLERHELNLFKEITSATSDRRSFDDKPLSYYQHFFDSWGDDAEFMLASLNFQDYYNQLQKQQEDLTQRIEKLKADLEKQPNSEKKQNQLRELSSQSETFDVRKAEALEFIDKYGEKTVPLAASLFVYTPQESVYFFSGSLPEFNRFYAPAVLQDYAMKESIRRGIPRYNLLGITGNLEEPDSILKFKQNFNGYITQKAGEFRYYPKPLKYKFIQIIKKILRR